MAQNMSYNAWTHSNYLGNVFVVTSNRKVNADALNAPGAFQNSDIAEWGGKDSKHDSIAQKNGGKCIVDSPF